MHQDSRPFAPPSAPTLPTRSAPAAGVLDRRSTRAGRMNLLVHTQLKGIAMKAVTWHGRRDVRVDSVPDPEVKEPTDAIIEVTSTNICGSDLHLYEALGAFMNAGDILGHEPMGIVREIGPAVTGLAVGDRVVIPFQISCGSCYMCDQQLFTQCETTQVRDKGMGAALFGYSELYGQVPGGQAELLRVPHAQFTHIKVPEGPPDSRFVYLSDVLPTAWQAVASADIPDGGSVTVLGLGPIGDMASRIAAHLGYQRQWYRSCGGHRLCPRRCRRVDRYLNEDEDAAEVARLVEEAGRSGNRPWRR
jgi:D-arabinose 1-dehydrogenase-like Zn-dependent alcohol dehydrogenase